MAIQRKMTAALVMAWGLLLVCACGQPKATPLPGEQPAWGAAHAQAVLEPFRAYAQREVFQYEKYGRTCGSLGLPLKGYMWPGKAEDQMVAVLFQPKVDTIPAEEMAWRVRLSDGTVREPVGFGGPLEGMIVTYGILEEGELTNLRGGENPLLALAFVLPRATEGLALIDPRGQEGSLNLSGTWRPGPEHLLGSFMVSAGAKTSMSCNGPGYMILPSLP